MTKCNSSFTLIESSDSHILIKDNKIGMSVTNDAENVVKYLSENFETKDKIIYYIDTEGRVDILGHDNNGNFTDFKLGYRNMGTFIVRNEQ